MLLPLIVMLLANMSSIRIFADLRVKYPSWDQLKQFLISAEGGKLAVIGDGPQVIIRYDKKTSDFQVPYVHAFRSVIWDTVANIPVSVAPFKAINDISAIGGATIIQDFVEGVMLHAFATGADNEFHLATRTKLGAETRYYSKRNFSDLVRDVSSYTDLNKILPRAENASYTFASLVLQHPEHRIVAPITEPRLYVVSIGCVYTDGVVTIQEDPRMWPADVAVLAPITQYGMIAGGPQEFVSAESDKRGWSWQGLIFKNATTLQRWRIRNPTYTTVRDLRGSDADSYARFLKLRKAGNLPLYIAYYPEEQAEFYGLEMKLREQSEALFNEYVIVNCVKKKSLNAVGWPLNNHVYSLHGIYIKKLKPSKHVLTLEMVTTYVNGLDLLKQRALLVTPVGGKVHQPSDTMME